MYLVLIWSWFLNKNYLANKLEPIIIIIVMTFIHHNRAISMNISNEWIDCSQSSQVIKWLLIPTISFKYNLCISMKTFHYHRVKYNKPRFGHCEHTWPTFVNYIVTYQVCDSRVIVVNSNLIIQIQILRQTTNSLTW